MDNNALDNWHGPPPMGQLSKGGGSSAATILSPVMTPRSQGRPAGTAPPLNPNTAPAPPPQGQQAGTAPLNPNHLPTAAGYGAAQAPPRLIPPCHPPVGTCTGESGPSVPMTNADDGTSVHHNDNTPVRKNNGGSAAEGSTERSTAHPISAVGNPYFADALSANRVTWTQGGGAPSQHACAQPQPNIAYSPPIACVVRNNVGSTTGGWTEQSTAHLISVAGNPYDADTLSATHNT